MPARYWVAIVSVPIVALGTNVFALYSNLYPLAQRAPWLGLLGGIIILAYHIMIILGGNEESQSAAPCSLTDVAINMCMIPLFLLTFLFRGIILLFKYEITQDMQSRTSNTAAATAVAAATAPLIGGIYETSRLGVSARGTPYIMSVLATAAASAGVPSSPTVPQVSSPSYQHHRVPSAGSPQLAGAATFVATGTTAGGGAGVAATGGTISVSVHPSSAIARPRIRPVSWYTAHYRYMKWQWLMRIAVIVFIITFGGFVFVAIGQGDTSCASHSIWWVIQYTIGAGVALCEGFILIIIARLLLRHQYFDMVGMKGEILMASCVVLVYAAVCLPIIVYGFEAYDVEGATTASLCTILWAITCLYPLGLSYLHTRRQQSIAADMLRAHNLESLLAIPLAVDCFTQYLAANFASESITFVLRARAFAKSSAWSLLGNSNHSRSAHTTPRVLGTNQQLNIDSATASPIPPPSPTTPTGAAGGNRSAAAIAASLALREGWAIYRSFVSDQAPFDCNISGTIRDEIAVELQQLTTACANVTRTTKRPAIIAAPPSSTVSTSSTPIIATTRTAAAAAAATNNTTPTAGDTGTTSTPVMTHRDGGTSSRISPAADVLLLQSILAIFDSAIEEVEHMIETVWLTRFRGSDEYKSLIASLQQLEQPRAPVPAAAAGGDDDDDDEAAAIQPSAQVQHLIAHISSPAAVASKKSRIRPSNLVADSDDNDDNDNDQHDDIYAHSIATAAPTAPQLYYPSSLQPPAANHSSPHHHRLRSGSSSSQVGGGGGAAPGAGGSSSLSHINRSSSASSQRHASGGNPSSLYVHYRQPSLSRPAVPSSHQLQMHSNMNLPSSSHSQSPSQSVGPVTSIAVDVPPTPRYDRPLSLVPPSPRYSSFHSSSLAPTTATGLAPTTTMVVSSSLSSSPANAMVINLPPSPSSADDYIVFTLPIQSSLGGPPIEPLPVVSLQLPSSSSSVE